MAERNFGVLVAPEGKRTRRVPGMLLDSDIPQFKYNKTILVKRTMPTSVAGNASLSLQFPHELGYVPAFSTFIRGYNGRWGRIGTPVQAAGFAAWKEFPYSGSERVDEKYYYADLNLIDNTQTVNAHTVLFRIIFFFDEMRLV